MFYLYGGQNTGQTGGTIAQHMCYWKVAMSSS